MKKTTAAAIAFALSLLSPPAMAATNTGTLAVTATVVETCSVTSTENIEFGNYDPTDPADNTAGQGFETFRCTRGTSYRVYITRANTMTDGTDSLTYELYSDPGRTSVYPDSSATGTANTALSNAPATTEIYGTVFPFQDARPGSYAETVTFTVEY
jgi:spore coat protein U-like protein